MNRLDQVHRRRGWLLWTFVCAVWVAASAAATAAAADPPAPAKLAANTVRAVGIGHPPAHIKGARARLMARRAAEVLAVRNLARKLRLPPRARIGGFRYALTEYRADGTVKVVVEYPRRR